MKFRLICAALIAVASPAFAGPSPFAILDAENRVANVIIGDAEDAGFITAFPGAVPLKAPGGVGSQYDPATETFDPPAAPPAPAQQWLHSAKLLMRFTAAERIQIRASTDPVVQDFLSLLNAADKVDLKDPTTIQGFQYLVSKGFLTSARAAEILS